MPSIVGDIRAIQRRCYELGIRGLTGRELKPADTCHIRLGLPTPECWCHRGNNVYDKCPPKKD